MPSKSQLQVICTAFVPKQLSYIAVCISGLAYCSRLLDAARPVKWHPVQCHERCDRCKGVLCRCTAKSANGMAAMTTASCSDSPQATCSRITRRVSSWMPGVCREDLKWTKSTWENVCIAPSAYQSSRACLAVIAFSCVVAACSDHHCPAAKTATANHKLDQQS